MSQQHSAAPATDSATAAVAARRRDWWREAVIYQVYPRSFADSNGDGMDDLEGVRSRLPYLRDLGVDAVWLSPFYASPQADAGYDVADYRAVDPMFGTLLDADALIRDAPDPALPQTAHTPQGVDPPWPAMRRPPTHPTSTGCSAASCSAYRTPPAPCSCPATGW